MIRNIACVVAVALVGSCSFQEALFFEGGSLVVNLGPSKIEGPGNAPMLVISVQESICDNHVVRPSAAALTENLRPS